MMAYPVPRLGGPCPPGRAPAQLLMTVPRSQEGGSSPTCCTPVSGGSSGAPPRPGGCLVGPPGSGGLCSCCPPGSNLVAAGYPGGLLPGLPEGMAAHPYLAVQGLSTFPPENPGMYPPILGGAFDPKDNVEFWAALRQSPYFPYEQGIMAHPYANAFALDPNARRKNATREGTNTLKAWLNEHKKNPYPTKGEKIMLAIITKMTLTQVSTWFANARRRLKKDNKVTWTTRGTDDDDDEGCLSSDEDGPSHRKSGGSQNGVEDDQDHEEDICVTDDDHEAIDFRLFSADPVQESLGSTDARSRVTPTPDSSEDHQCRQPNRTTQSGSNHSQTTNPPFWSENMRPTTNIDPVSKREDTTKAPSTKPKIWSLADVASKDSPEKRRHDRVSGSEANVTSSSGLTSSPMRGSGQYPGAWGSAMMFPYPRHVIPQHIAKPMTSPSSAMTLASSSSSTASSTTH